MTATTFSQWVERQFADTDVYAKDIAARADLSQGYLSGLRTGKRPNPVPEVAARIATAFAEERGLGPTDTEALQAEAVQAALRSPVRRMGRAAPRSKRTGFGLLRDVHRRSA
jgi:transcriptional regulator with XRE-family HTH domain